MKIVRKNGFVYEEDMTLSDNKKAVHIIRAFGVIGFVAIILIFFSISCCIWHERRRNDIFISIVIGCVIGICSLIILMGCIYVLIEILVKQNLFD